MAKGAFQILDLSRGSRSLLEEKGNSGVLQATSLKGPVTRHKVQHLSKAVHKDHSGVVASACLRFICEQAAVLLTEAVNQPGPWHRCRPHWVGPHQVLTAGDLSIVRVASHLKDSPS